MASGAKRVSAPACSTDLGQWLQVIEHQVRQPAHVVVHVPLRQVRQEPVVPERMLATAPPHLVNH